VAARANRNDFMEPSRRLESAFYSGTGMRYRRERSDCVVQGHDASPFGPAIYPSKLVAIR